MSEYDRFLELVLEKLPGMTKSGLEQLIKIKKSKIGAGYLTDQGALFLIASDLGISLAEAYQQRVSPMDKIKVNEVSPEDLKNKIKNLRDEKRRKWLRNNLTFPISFVVLYGAGGIANLYNQPNNPLLIIPIIALIASIVSIIYLIKMSTRYLEKNEILLLEFFTAHKKISQYKYKKAKSDLKKYQEAIGDLAYFIGSWTRKGAPTAISELPNSLSSNLRTMIIPIFQQSDTKQINQFIKLLEKIINLSFDQELTAEVLRALNEEIAGYKIQTKTVEEKIPNMFKRLIWIPLVAGIVFFYVLYKADPSQLQSALGWSVTTAVAILIAIVTLARRIK